MYTDEDYKLAKKQLAELPKETPGYSTVQQRVREYERYNPQHSVEATGLDKIAETEKEFPRQEAKTSIPELPADKPGAETLGVSDALQVDPDIDTSLASASKKKSVYAPPEYASKNPLANVGHVLKATAIDPLNGPAAGAFFEPTERQFQKEMGPILKARGIEPGSPGYDDALAEFRDRKWKQAYDQAQATDTPLTRIAHVSSSGSWDKLKNILAQGSDLASTFAKGYVQGVFPGSRDAVDALGGKDVVEADREQAARNPTTEFAAETAGAFNPVSIASRVAGGVGKLGLKYLPGLAGRFGASALAGASAAGTDLAGKSAGQAVADVVSGGSTQDAKDRFTQSILPAAGLGALAGTVGEGLSLGANKYQRSVSSSYPLLGPFREGGGDTSLLGGLKPSPEVEANLEAAREPIPGEAKAAPKGSPVELAAEPLREPLTIENAKSIQEAEKAAADETAAMYAADPKLHEPKPMANTAKATLSLLRSRLQPEEAEKFLPGMPVTAKQSLFASDNGELAKLAGQAWKPELALTVDAGQIAARAGGPEAITIAEARKLGLDVPGLASELGPEGVPHDAPPINLSEDVFGRPIKPPEHDTGSDFFDPDYYAQRFQYIYGETKRPDLSTGLAGNDNPTRVSASPPIGAPSPADVRAGDAQKVGGIPESEYRVVLVPRRVDALTHDTIVSAIHEAAKAGSGRPPPEYWGEFQQAAMADREQFGPAWAAMKQRQHEAFNALEARAGAAGIQGKKPFSEMTTPQRQQVDARLQAYGSSSAKGPEKAALRDLAAKAGVLDELKTLGAQNAYQEMKGVASPKLVETLDPGGVRGQLRGMGPAVKLRADAAARAVSRGPTGEVIDYTPSAKALEFLRQYGPRVTPKAAGPVANMFSMGGGALGLKAGAAYNSLTPEQYRFIQRILGNDDKEKHP